MSEERLALMRAYFQALKRLEERAAGIAFELDLSRLRGAIIDDLAVIDRQIGELAEYEAEGNQKDPDGKLKGIQGLSSCRSPVDR